MIDKHLFQAVRRRVAVTEYSHMTRRRQRTSPRSNEFIRFVQMPAVQIITNKFVTTWERLFLRGAYYVRGIVARLTTTSDISSACGQPPTKSCTAPSIENRTASASPVREIRSCDSSRSSPNSSSL